MPTVKLKIDMGIEFSSSDGVGSTTELHNFIVGKDESIYKFPVLKNLKGPYKKTVPSTSGDYGFCYPIHDIITFETSGISEDVSIPSLPPDADFFISTHKFSRYLYLTVGSYGVINVDYQSNRVINSQLPADKIARLGEFEKVFIDVNDLAASGIEEEKLDLEALGSKIIVDINSQYTLDANFRRYRDPSKSLRCIFPAQYRWIGDLNFSKPDKNVHDYTLNIKPRNIVNVIMNASTPPGDTDLLPLTSNEPIKYFPKDDQKFLYNNDLARGPVIIGNRMVFYSIEDNCLYVSKKADFSGLEIDIENNDNFRLIPTEELHSIVEFNGNLITFSPTGINRWVLSSDNEEIFVKDPTFHYNHRVRFGSFVKANRDLYYTTYDFHVYRMSPDFSVTKVFNGTLPIYYPLSELLEQDKEMPMSYFEMLGYRFITVGAWLYNIDTETWSTYTLDGWRTPDNSALTNWIWNNDLSKQIISTGIDNIICTYANICKPLTYSEMQKSVIFDDTVPSMIEGKHQWGELAFFSTRMYQDDQIITLTGVAVYVRGGILNQDSILWLKVLKGSESGDFDEGDESDYGKPGTYQPLDASELGGRKSEYVGRFVWRNNIRTDRFRLKFITKEKRGMIIESVLANIYKPNVEKGEPQQG